MAAGSVCNLWTPQVPLRGKQERFHMPPMQTAVARIASSESSDHIDPALLPHATGTTYPCNLSPKVSTALLSLSYAILLVSHMQFAQRQPPRRANSHLYECATQSAMAGEFAPSQQPLLARAGLLPDSVKPQPPARRPGLPLRIVR